MRILAGVTCAAILGLGTAIASAADLPVKAPPRVSAPAFSWTGCYVGGNVGGLWVDKDYELSGTGADRGSHSANSILGGVQAGCNYQFPSAFVVGIQGDYDWTDARGSHIDLGAATITDQSRTRNLASVTGRVGYAGWERFLLYVKGGGAWERDSYIGFTTATGAVVDSARQTRSGWTVGVGGEYAFAPNWTVFVEYDYYDFGNRSVQFLTPAGAPSVLFNIRETKDVVKVGVNWKFF